MNGLYYAILFYAMIYYTILYHTIPYYTIYTVLFSLSVYRLIRSGLQGLSLTKLYLGRDSLCILEGREAVGPLPGGLVDVLGSLSKNSGLQRVKAAFNTLALTDCYGVYHYMKSCCSFGYRL